MADRSGIEWLARPGTIPASWNPITGCTPCSEGCLHCYAKAMVRRFGTQWGLPADDPFRVTFHPDRLDRPLRWKKPRTIFVCSMADLWHRAVPKGWRRCVLSYAASARQHTYIFLTKRPLYISADWSEMPNWWLGVTVENQRRARQRVPRISRSPAAVRFVSCEPLLGPIDLTPWLGKLDWVIVGAETGPGKRPMDLDWARSICEQCVAAGVPFFFKRDSQGRDTLDGRQWRQWPEVTR